MKKNPRSNRFYTAIDSIGWIGTLTGIAMYVTYIPQIARNLAGQPGTPIQPLVAAINCSLWSIYAMFKRQRDWPVFWANFPGVIFGLITCITAFMA